MSPPNRPGAENVPTQTSSEAPLRASPPPPSPATERVIATPISPANQDASSNVSRRLQRKLAKRAKRDAKEQARVGKLVTSQGEEANKREIPPWLVSLTFHIAFILVLALIPLGQQVKLPLSFQMDFASPENVEFALTGAANVAMEPEMAAAAQIVKQPFELLSVDVENKLTEVEPELGNTQAATMANIPVPLATGLTGRQGDSKKALLDRYGGTERTEAAVEMGLRWLVKQQRPDGSWSMTGPYRDAATIDNRTAATALALNAFLGAGYTHEEGKYQEVVAKGLNYLINRQDSEGFFAAREPSQQFMYAQAIATIAVVEAYGMTEDSNLYGPAVTALSWAEWAQSEKNGWRYGPRDDADLSVTGWYLMALETGKMAGLKVDEQKLNNVTKLLDELAYEDGSRYAYNMIENEPRLTMTAEGLLCRIYLGWPKTHPSLLKGVENRLLRAAPAHGDPKYSVYFWYYATQVLHHIGGRSWDTWNRSMRTVIPDRQTTEGKEAGSWDPKDDLYGTSGRLYTTCLNIYCLEVYYRHLSIYDLNRR